MGAGFVTTGAAMGLKSMVCPGCVGVGLRTSFVTGLNTGSSASVTGFNLSTEGLNTGSSTGAGVMIGSCNDRIHDDWVNNYWFHLYDGVIDIQSIETCI